MALDKTGIILGGLIAKALALPTPPTNPTPEQEAAYVSAQAAQLATWTTISQQIINYLIDNTTVTTSDTVSGAGSQLNDSTSHPCSGTLNSTGTGTGTIK